MLTKEQIYGGNKYQWNTDKPLYTFYEIMCSFIYTQLAKDVKITDLYGIYCEVKIDYNRYGIKVYANGDCFHHVAEIELLE